MLHPSLHPVDVGQGHRDQRRARYAPMNPGAFCHPLHRGRVDIVSPREPYLAALTTARRLISGCGSETLSRSLVQLLIVQLCKLVAHPVAPEPPRRRSRARSRRCLRLPPQTKGVGCWFHPVQLIRYQATSGTVAVALFSR